MQLVYRLYLLQILLLLASLLLHGILKTIATALLCLLMAFLWYVLWGAARLAAMKTKIQTHKEWMEEIRHIR